jgi:hypothetical protein
MNASAEDFRRHFDLLSDAALLSTNRDDLTGIAQTCFDEEVARRGLGEKEVAATEEEAAAPEDTQDEMVLIATYSVAEEASLARGLLDSASIPARIASDYVAMGQADYQLLVPKEFQEHALEILEYQISDEELAAQAEEADFTDD